MLVTVYCPSSGVGLAGLPVTGTYVSVVDAPGTMVGKSCPGLLPLPKVMFTTGSPREPVQRDTGVQELFIITLFAEDMLPVTDMPKGFHCAVIPDGRVKYDPFMSS